MVERWLDGTTAQIGFSVVTVGLQCSANCMFLFLLEDWKCYSDSGCFAVKGFSFSHNQHFLPPISLVFLINISK